MINKLGLFYAFRESLGADPCLKFEAAPELQFCLNLPPTIQKNQEMNQHAKTTNWVLIGKAVKLLRAEHSETLINAVLAKAAELAVEGKQVNLDMKFTTLTLMNESVSCKEGAAKGFSQNISPRTRDVTPDASRIEMLTI